MYSHNIFLFHRVQFRIAETILLLFGVTLHRLKFPSSVGYISAFSSLGNHADL